MKKRKINKNPKVKKVEVVATAKTTKYFGKVSLNQWGEFDGKLNGKNVRISMAGFNDLCWLYAFGFRKLVRQEITCCVG